MVFLFVVALGAIEPLLAAGGADGHLGVEDMLADELIVRRQFDAVSIHFVTHHMLRDALNFFLNSPISLADSEGRCGCEEDATRLKMRGRWGVKHQKVWGSALRFQEYV